VRTFHCRTANLQLREPVTTNWKLGLGLSLVTAVMWGLLPLALKAVLEVMDPVTISWYRFSVSAAIAMLWFGHQRGGALKNLLLLRHLPLSLAVVGGLTGNYLLYIWGLDYINPGAVQILIQIAPLLLLAGSVVIFRERFSNRQWSGVVALGIGLLLFFHLRIDRSVTTSEGYLVGVALTVTGALVWSIYGLAQKQLLRDFHAKDILLLICVSGTLVLWPLSEPGQLWRLDAAQLLLLAFCGLNTIIAYGCFGLAMSHWQASRVSAVITVAPLLTLLFTVILNRWWPDSTPAEPLDWLSYLGALLVVTGAAVTALSGQDK
jgi:drug/metabolite transporter (DMT)-like permease